MDNLTLSDMSSWASCSCKSESLCAKCMRDLTSPQDPLAMYKYFTKCLAVPCSNPSAILVDMEIAALSTWFLSENCLQSLKHLNTFCAKSIADCHTRKSSNLPLLITMEFTHFSSTSSTWLKPPWKESSCIFLAKHSSTSSRSFPLQCPTTRVPLFSATNYDL